MQGNDHAALARFLLNQLPSSVSLLHKTTFFIGCIEPDFNPFTYMRGSIRHRFMHGHNAENARDHIRKCLDKMQNSIPESKFDYFTLGTIIHYIADSFTFTHNQAFTGTMKDHVAYEKRLNPIFLKALTDILLQSIGLEQTSIFASFTENHDSYIDEPASMDKDCRYIISACTATFRLAIRQIEVPDMQIWRTLYENSYYNRLV